MPELSERERAEFDRLWVEFVATHPELDSKSANNGTCGYHWTSTDSCPE
jgi:hypothetical protein